MLTFQHTAVCSSASGELTLKLRLSNLTFRGPCIVLYSYNESQRDALFLKFILVKNSTCFGLSIIRSLNTVFAAIGTCHTIYVDAR